MAEEYEMLRKRTGTLIHDYGDVVCELVRAPAEKEKTEHESPDRFLNNLLDSYYRLKNYHEEQALNVAVLALTKSGKSTFLNAILGRDCMPTGTVPETARICRIVHDDSLSEPILTDGDTQVCGQKPVYDHLQALNKDVRSRPHRIYDEAVLTVRTPFAALAGQTGAKARLHLLDTPGPNEAGEDGLKYQVERLLESVGAVVYLLDCSKLKTLEEQEMFQRLKEINPQILSRLSERLFFLVNKKDVLGADLTEDGVRQYVADLVTDQMASPEFQLRPEQVMVMSAKHALYSRLLLSGDAAEEDVDTFARIAFGSIGGKQKTREDCCRAAPELLAESGIPEVEDRILNFLYRNAGRLQMLGTLDDMGRHIGQIHNAAIAREAALRQESAELSDHTALMISKLEDVTKRFNDIQKTTVEAEANVSDEVKARMLGLRDRLFEQIEAVMSESHQNKLASGWRSLWNRFKTLFGNDSESFLNENDAQNRLTDLYLSINGQIEEEVRGFWRDLELMTNSRQRDVFETINRKLEELKTEVEAVVMEELDVRLEPADISISMPSLSEHHDDLRALFSKGISVEEIVHQVQDEVEDTVIEKHYHMPLCKFGEYYVARPVSRKESREVKELKAKLSLNKVKEFFFNHVDEMVSRSLQSVESVISWYLGKRLQSAEGKLEEYCSSYRAVMATSLDDVSKGEEERNQALDRAVKHVAAVADLQERHRELVSELSKPGPLDEDAPEYVCVGEDAGEDPNAKGTAAGGSILIQAEASDIRDSAEDSAEALDAAEAGADAEEHGSLSPEFIHGARVTADGADAGAKAMPEEAVGEKQLFPATEPADAEAEQGHSEQTRPDSLYPTVVPFSSESGAAPLAAGSGGKSNSDNDTDAAPVVGSPAVIQASNDPLPVSQGGSNSDVPSGPFDYESGFMESMSIHEDLGPKEDDDFILVDE